MPTDRYAAKYADKFASQFADEFSVKYADRGSDSPSAEIRLAESTELASTGLPTITEPPVRPEPINLQNDQFFNSILTITHPLCQEVVRSVVGPRPGIYLIVEPPSKSPAAPPPHSGSIDLNQALNHSESFGKPSSRVIYVGRSTTNLQQRLTQHCRNRDYHGLYFSFHYAKSGVESFRLESRAIFYFNKIFKLRNRIHAAFLARKSNE